MTAEILTSLVTANLVACAAVLLALALRRPLRRMIGARAAYGLWLIVPVAMLATLAPSRPATEAALAAPIRPAAQAAVEQIGILAGAARGPIAPRGVPDLSALVYVWMAGAALYIVFLAFGQWRAVARFGLLGRDAEGYTRAANRNAGPALIGLVRPRIVLPTDFESRFQPREQAMILAHERAHLKAGHLWINAVTALIRALNWFNPLLHLGAYYARVDQEFACDAAVAERFPGERRTYAQAMLKTQLAAAPLPLGCYWPGGSSTLLQERIEMLASNTPTLARRLVGAAAVAVLLGGAGLAAWAASPPQRADDVKYDTDNPSAGPVHVEPGAAAPEPTDVCLTNACGAARLSAPNPQAIRAAIAKGDARAAFLAGGDAEDVLNARIQADEKMAWSPFSRDRNGQTLGERVAPGTAQFTTGPGGKLLISYRTKTGGLQAEGRSDISDLPAPPGILSMNQIRGLPGDAVAVTRPGPVGPMGNQPVQIIGYQSPSQPGVMLQPKP